MTGASLRLGPGKKAWKEYEIINHKVIDVSVEKTQLRKKQKENISIAKLRCDET